MIIGAGSPTSAAGLQEVLSAGLHGPHRDDRHPAGRAALLDAAWAYERYGAIGATVVLAGERYGDRAAIVDERGTLSFARARPELECAGLAWRSRGLRPVRVWRIMARNHRGLLEALFAAAKCGARIVLLNTDFSGAPTGCGRPAGGHRSAGGRRGVPAVDRRPARAARNLAGLGRHPQGRTPSTRSSPPPDPVLHPGPGPPPSSSC